MLKKKPCGLLLAGNSVRMHSFWTENPWVRRWLFIVTNLQSEIKEKLWNAPVHILKRVWLQFGFASFLHCIAALLSFGGNWHQGIAPGCRLLNNRAADPRAWKTQEVNFRSSLMDFSSSVSVSERLSSAATGGWQMAPRCFTALATVSWHWAQLPVCCRFSLSCANTQHFISPSLSLSLSRKGKVTTGWLRCALLGTLGPKCDD